MKLMIKNNLLITWLLVMASLSAIAQNPIIRNQYSADPTARVFNGKMYLYPSHDIDAPSDFSKGEGWFCMHDYHVFSSENLVDWTDHGVILSQDDVDWVLPRSYSMWAPDCVEKNGKYYFFFPAKVKGTKELDEHYGVGVAIADSPSGSFTPMKKNIEGIHGIDPNVFFDKDGTAYIYFSEKGLWVAKLSDDLLSLASEPCLLSELPADYKEGPFMFERNGIYYLTYPLSEGDREVIVYSISDNPCGPFEYKGVIMGKDYSAYSWTNHHSIVEYKGQWYMFYHHNDYDHAVGHHRSVKADKLYFNEDGTIREVVPTRRGIGVIPADRPIQMDRYSYGYGDISEDFVNKDNHFEGWYITMRADSYVKINDIDFGKKRKRSFDMRVKAKTESTVYVRVSDNENTWSKKYKISPSDEWNIIERLSFDKPEGVCDITIGVINGEASMDWINFK